MQARPQSRAESTSQPVTPATTTLNISVVTTSSTFQRAFNQPGNALTSMPAAAPAAIDAFIHQLKRIDWRDFIRAGRDEDQPETEAALPAEVSGELEPQLHQLLRSTMEIHTLIADTFLDGLQPVERLKATEHAVTEAYLQGLTEAGHGGIILVVPSANDEWRRSLASPIEYLLEPPWDTLRKTVESLMDATQVAALRANYEAALQAVGALSAVDGALVIRDDLTVVGYGAKMGLAPMHTWKPDAYGEAPPPVAALLSGGLTNVAFLAIVRIAQLCSAAGESAFLQPMLVVLGLVSLGVAAASMLGHGNYRRMLAYSSVEHVGILTLAVGVGGLAAYGGLLHAVNNAVNKGILFLAAGCKELVDPVRHDRRPPGDDARPAGRLLLPSAAEREHAGAGSEGPFGAEGEPAGDAGGLRVVVVEAVGRIDDRHPPPEHPADGPGLEGVGVDDVGPEAPDLAPHGEDPPDVPDRPGGAVEGERPHDGAGGGEPIEELPGFERRSEHPDPVASTGCGRSVDVPEPSRPARPTGGPTPSV